MSTVGTNIGIIASTGKGARATHSDQSQAGWETWLFILGEMSIFACFFFVYAYQRGQTSAEFMADQQQLSQSMGALNTLLLLTSSWFVVLAIRAIRLNNRVASQRWFLFAGLSGLGFLFVKAIEWGTKISQGFTWSVSDFAAYYYVLTGVHLAHVMTGLIVLTVLWNHIDQKNSPNHVLLESGALYWHMVDLLWIILFPLLYLMR